MQDVWNVRIKLFTDVDNIAHDLKVIKLFIPTKRPKWHTFKRNLVQVSPHEFVQKRTINNNIFHLHDRTPLYLTNTKRNIIDEDSKIIMISFYESY